MEWIHKEIDEQLELMHNEIQALEEEGDKLKKKDYCLSIHDFEKYQKARYYLLKNIKLAWELKHSAQ